MQEKQQRKVGLILNPYGEKYAAGLGRSIFSLADSIISNNENTLFVVYLKGFETKDPVFKTNNFEIKRLPASLFWLDLGLWDEAKLDAYVFFTPFLPYFVKVPHSLVVVHDLAYRTIKAVSLGEWCTRILLRFIHGRSLKKAKEIVTVSQATKEDVLHYYPHISSEKIHVVYDGFDPQERVEPARPSKLKDSNFFLFVGVMKNRKNVMRIIEAFEEYKKTSHNDDLLVFAGKCQNKEIENRIAKSFCASDMVILGYVKDSELSYLYKNTMAFVFPSLVEGFGMPILEAMSLGTPVITSDRGAMKEIAGGSAYLVNPESVSDIAKALSVLKDKDKQAELREKGLIRAGEFSWDKAGERYVEILHNVINSY